MDGSGSPGSLVRVRVVLGSKRLSPTEAMGSILRGPLQGSQRPRGRRPVRLVRTQPLTLCPPTLRHVLHMFPLRNVRKMCVVLQHNLGKGTRWPRPRCIPPRLWCSWGIEPIVAPVKRIAVLSLARGAFALLLHHHRSGRLRSPVEPSIKGETLALPSELPINQDLEICLSTWTEPCTNDWRFGCHVGGAFLLSPSPHDRRQISFSLRTPTTQPVGGYMRSSFPRLRIYEQGGTTNVRKVG
jgi:hypothetical protein